jgi:hypothetical protein
VPGRVAVRIAAAVLMAGPVGAAEIRGSSRFRFPRVGAAPAQALAANRPPGALQFPIEVAPNTEPVTPFS